MKRLVVALAVAVGLVCMPGLAQAFEGPERIGADEPTDLRNAHMQAKPDPRNPIKLPRPIEFEPIPQDPGAGKVSPGGGSMASGISGLASGALGGGARDVETRRDVRRIIRNLD